ncbi:MAG TPA: YhcH/YjgK/YiaL family protein [Cyclobacteriaceae bacterium]|nr:YhcH/YjgK/YiaL family protein [Cyclobacteriaceae bacterium]
MIIDTLTNSGKYSCIHPLFSEAFEFIANQDLDAMEPGNYEIAGEELKAVVMDKAGKTAAESLEKFECHNAHIDIQVCIQGDEQIGWKPRADCSAPKGDYNAEKDVLFYNDSPDVYFQLKAGQFVILFPEDVHAPMISEGNIKKLVVKVKI